MAANVSHLGPVSFAIDACLTDDSIYSFASPGGEMSGSLAIEIEASPEETPAWRLRMAAEEMGRVYDDSRLEAQGVVGTAFGPASVLTARLDGAVAVGMAAVSLGGRRLYFTATAIGQTLAEFVAIVESARPDKVATLPPSGRRWTGAGPARLLVPEGWTSPSTALFSAPLLRVRIDSGELDLRAENEPAAASMLPLSPGESLTLDGEEPPLEERASAFVFTTRVAAYSVLGPEASPVDAIMVRKTTVTWDSTQGTAAMLVGVARSAAWPELVATWETLRRSLEIGA